jgi:large subunit ribosomal protein L25
MIALVSQQRNKEEKVAVLRKEGFVPGILYGPKADPVMVKVAEKEFQKVYEEAGESSLIQLESENGGVPVLIREIQKEPLRGKPIHVDFYQPRLDEKIEVMVPLVFEGDAPAVATFGGTLEKHIQEVEVKALPQSLPNELVVDVSGLVTLEDRILVKDLVCAPEVEILRDAEDVICQVAEAQDVEAQLEQSVEENVEAVGEAKEKKEEYDSTTAEEEKAK